MPLFSERRLLHYTIEQIKKMQAAAGVTPTITGTSRTSAQTNATTQAQTHQQTLAAQQAEAATQMAAQGQTQGASYYQQQAQNLQPTAAAPSQTGPISPNFDTHGMTSEAISAKAASIAAQNTEILKQQQIKQQMAVEQAQRQAAGGAAASAAANTNPVAGGRFQGPSDAAPDRQSFIEQQRVAGKTDAEIRQMINTLPPEQTGGASSTPTSQNPTSPDAPGTPQTGSVDPEPVQSKPPSGEASAPPPQDAAFDALIAGTTDPQLKAVLQALKAQAALTATGPEMTQGEFMAGAGAIAQPYDAIQSIINNATSRLETGEKAMKSFLEKQYERNDKYMAAQQENLQNQITFQNDRAVRDQADANKKMLDSQTIMLALQGGFGSADGNREVAEARLKGEQAIIDLNKEYGFKKTDISLQFTQMHNEAFDKYQQAWLQATDDFESRISNLDIQGISNQQAKSTALSSAYKDYTASIKEARKEHAKLITSATNMVYDHMAQEKADKARQQETLWDRLFQQRAMDGNMNPTLTQSILAEMQKAGIDTSSLDPNSMTLEQQNELYRRTMDAQTTANAGKIPLVTQVQQLTDADKAFSLLNEAESKIREYAGVGGPIAGMSGLGDTDPSFLASVGKFGADIATGIGAGSSFERQREAVATFNLVQQVIGKALEGGVLRKEDEVKYSKLLPNLRDTDSLRKYKLDQLREMMTEGKKSLLDNMNRSGYNTSGYNTDGHGHPLDPLDRSTSGILTNEEADDLLRQIEETEISGKPLSVEIGGRKVKGVDAALGALQKADREFFADTGQHLFVNSSFRSSADQQAAYDRYRRGEISRAAPPGHSLHEKGIAFDITNWKEAEPYLIKYGFKPLPKNIRSSDPAHFSYGIVG